MMTRTMVVALLAISIMSISCHDHHGHGHDHDHDHDHTTASNATNTTTPAPPRSMKEAYIYGTISVTVVSLLSLAGVIVLPFMKRKTIYNSIMLVFMSLAVGTMTTDAILHLIPETLGLHGHHHGHHDHSIQEDKPYLGKLVLLLGVLYALYQLEVLARVVSRIFKKTTAIHDADSKKSKFDSKTSSKDTKVDVDSGKQNNIEMWSGKSPECGHSHHGHSHGMNSPVSGDHPYTTICGLESIAFIVTVGDAMHNFSDGLAIGAAFAKSSAAGLAVSIAVVCHELPHEVGDFAILLNTGMSVKKALLINFVSALTCFIGVYPGIVAGQQEGLRQWIFAAVAGGFLYVALVHMLREIKDFGQLPRYLSITLQNVGLIVGFGIVLLLAIYEDKLMSE